jgi:DNA-binding MarR family transcriptional regulator
MTVYEICLIHSKADRAIRLELARQLQEFNITMMQWLLLATVKAGSTNGVRMTELADILDVTMPQITALMNDLVKQKLTKQKINSTDRRSRRLTLTPAGKALLEQISPRIEKGVKHWLSTIPADNLKIYLDTAKKLANLQPSNQ